MAESELAVLSNQCLDRRIPDQPMLVAEVKGVAELRSRDEQEFWTGDASLQDSVFTAFAATGSRIVVATHAPVTVVKEGWIRLGNTGYYARSLLAKP